MSWILKIHLPHRIRNTTGMCSRLQNGGTRLLVSLVTGVLPSVIGLLWTSFVMPHLLYFCASIRRG